MHRTADSTVLGIVWSTTLLWAINAKVMKTEHSILDIAFCFALASLTLLPFCVSGNDDQQGFIQNKGQIHDQFRKANPSVLYLLNGRGMNVQLKNDGFAYDTYVMTERTANTDEEESNTSQEQWDRPTDARSTTYRFHRIDLRFVNGNPDPEILREGESEHYTNYYTDLMGEAGTTFVRSYSTITYRNVWPNIDVRFNCGEEGFKYDVIVRPSGRLDDVRFTVEGARISERMNGRLLFTWANEEMEERIPESWIVHGTEHERVDVGYEVTGHDTFGFTGADGPDGTLIIDPQPVLLWATYYGGPALETPGGVGLDVQGNSYMNGLTQSTWAMATSNAHDAAYSGNSDSYLVKFDANGNRIWATYFGGPGYDDGDALVVHDAGYVVVGGATESTSAMATVGAHQIGYSGNRDGYIAKFSSNGVRMWSTYYGGSAADDISGLDIGSDESIAFCGTTTSTNNIALPNADQYGLSGPKDGFAGRLTSNGGRIWASYVGGTASDEVHDITFMGSLSVGVVGRTNSANRLGQSNGGGNDITYNGGWDAFAARYSPTGTKSWATYCGGSGSDTGADIAYVGLNQILICGHTSSTSGIATPGAAQPFFGGGEVDGFVTSLTVSNGIRQWGTYHGGNEMDLFSSVARLAGGYSIVLGTTKPVTTGPVPGPHFMVIYSNSGALQSEEQFAYGVKWPDQVDVNGSEMAIAAYLHAEDADFSTSNAYQPVPSGGGDTGLLRYTIPDNMSIQVNFGAVGMGQLKAIVQNGLLEVITDNAKDSPTSITINDMSGRLVDQRSMTGKSNVIRLPEYLQQGVYIITVTQADGSLLSQRIHLP